MASKTIPELNPVTSFNGNALIPIDSGTQTFKITSLNFAKSIADLAPSDSFISKWISSRTYAANDMVFSGGNVYVSLAGSNTNHDPVTALNFWKQVKSAGMNPQVSAALATRAISLFTARSLPAVELWTDICYAENTGTLFAVSQTGTNRAAKSTDGGKTWTAITTIPAEQWTGVCHIPEINRVIAVAVNGFIAYSDDEGATWIDSGGFPAGAHEFKRIRYSPELGQLLCVLLNSDDLTETVYVSTDFGINFTFGTGQLEVCQDHIWVAKWGLWIAIYSSGTNRIMTSLNGTTWTARTAPSASFWSCLAFSPSLEIAVALSKGTGKGMYTRNGIDWVEFNISTDSWVAIAWSEEFGIFLAVASSGSTNYAMTSLDGVTWATRTVPGTNFFTTVVFAAKYGMFSAVADGGTNTAITSRFVKKLIAV